MTDDDRPSAHAPRTSVALRGPAEAAISEFLTAHRALPPRTRGDRLLGRSPLTEGTVRWFSVANSELEVVAALDRLAPEWTILHGIPGPSSSAGGERTAIDHLVIGPSGVYVITTRNHARQNVWVGRRAFVADGHRLQHIRAAEAMVGHVERMLEAATGVRITVGAVIAVVDPGSLRVHDLPPDVFVVAADRLRPWLKARDRRLDPDTVCTVATAAALDRTWGDHPVADDHLAVIRAERAEFDRVRREVTVARLVHRAWVIGAATVLAGLLVAIGIVQLVSSSPLGLS